MLRSLGQSGRHGSGFTLLELIMVIVILGYCCGIASHLVEGTTLWLVAVYLVDIALVSTDLALYCLYSRRNSAAAAN